MVIDQNVAAGLESSKLKENSPMQRCIYFIVVILRLLIGATFVFSGFVKVIDPWGTVYKFSEYFYVLDLDFLVSLITLFAYLLSISEFVLGILVLLGCYRRASIWLTMALMALMLPLTLYLAITNNVADCGCFGDAVHLSNWTTFLKNVVIVAGLIFLCKYNTRVGNVYTFPVQWIIVLFSGIFSYLVCFVGYEYQPLMDFRDFKIGSHLVETKEKTDKEPEFKFVYKKDGEEKEFGIDDLPDEEDGWEFVDRKAIGNIPSAEDMGNYLTVINNDGEDITNDVILNKGKEIIFLFPDLGDIEISSTFAINEICDLAKKENIKTVGLTSMSEDAINNWIDLSMAAYPIYMIDDSILKQIARGNPAIVYLSDGVIKWKRAMSSIPLDDLSKKELKIEQIGSSAEDSQILNMLIITYLSAMMLLLILDKTCIIIKLKLRLDKKNKNKDVTL